MARSFTPTDYLSAGPSVTAVAFTFAGWMYVDESGSSRVCLSLGDTNAVSFFHLSTTAGNAVLAQARLGGTIGSATAGTFTDNVWFHAAAVFGGAASRFAYYNGAPGSEETTNVTPTGIDNTAIGVVLANSTTYFPMSGSLAEVGLWNVALTTAEIAQLAAGYSPLFVRPQNLVGYWDLVRGLNDRVGGLDMSDTGGSTVSVHPPVIMPASPLIVGVPAAVVGVAPTGALDGPLVGPLGGPI